MSILTAEQKVRFALTGDPFGEPQFQHEGEEIIRWITGGTQPDIYVTFHRGQENGRIDVRCANCQALLGDIPPHFGGDTAKRLASMREHSHC